MNNKYQFAGLMETESSAGDAALLFAALEKINHRLDKIEISLADPRTATPNPISTHPSTERFAVAEAIADEIFAGIQKEKACTFEPNGKPCDHCSMCSSRGF